MYQDVWQTPMSGTYCAPSVSDVLEMCLLLTYCKNVKQNQDNRPVCALSGIIGNQRKIAKKQSSKIYVYLHIFILRFI